MKDQAPQIVEDLRWLHPPTELVVNPWLLTGIVLLSLAIVGLVLFLMRRRKKTGHIFAPLLPHEKALKALRALASAMDEANDGEFIVQVSQIVRDYIQERFELRAPHRSTEEFLQEARFSAALKEDHQELLRAFLTQCDLVKFAKRRAVLAQMQNLHQSAVRFVEGTIPEVKPGAAAHK